MAYLVHGKQILGKKTKLGVEINRLSRYHAIISPIPPRQDGDEAEL